MKKLITLLLVLTGMVSTASAWNYLKGTFNGWEAQPAFCLDNGPVAVYLEANIYTFKVHDVDNNKWYGAENDAAANITETTTITSSSFSTDGSAANFQLTVSVSGYYVFTTNWDNGLSLTVRYPDTMVYFYNALGWSNVYLHDGWWNDSNGATNRNALRGVEMIPGENNIYSAFLPKESFYHVTFTSDQQVNNDEYHHGEGYNNFYDTDVVWDANSFSKPAPLYVPTTSASETINDCSYYYGGTYHAYPTYTRTVTSGKFGTICLPFAATVTGATIYKIKNKKMNGGTVEGINLETVVGDLEAGTPYIFKATESTLTATYSGTYSDAKAANGMIGNIGSSITVTPDAGYYVIGGDNLIHEVVSESESGNSNVTVGQYKAYITLEDVGEASSREANFIAFEDGGATGISQIENGELNNESYFDLQGRRVAQPTKGLYIVNGKKVIIK